MKHLREKEGIKEKRPIKMKVGLKGRWKERKKESKNTILMRVMKRKIVKKK